LPHNWALLVRRGGGSRLVLERWASAMGCARCGWPNDQYALQAVLAALQRTGIDGLYCASGGLWWWRNTASGGTRCARVMRLRESAATSFKSVSKSDLGFFPRYTRLVESAILATHKPRVSSVDVCRALNEQPTRPRLLLQPGSATLPRPVYNRSRCHVLLAGAPPRAQLLCLQLPNHTAAATPPQPAAVAREAAVEMVEPIERFWQWAQQWPKAADSTDAAAAAVEATATEVRAEPEGVALCLVVSCEHLRCRSSTSTSYAQRAHGERTSLLSTISSTTLMQWAVSTAVEASRVRKTKRRWRFFVRW